MEDSNKPRKPKRPYEKPTLSSIEISLEESLLAPCKGDGNFGSPVPAPCNTCGTIGS